MLQTPIRFILTAAKPYRWRFLKFFIWSGIGIVCFTASPFIIGQLINTAIADRALSQSAWILVAIYIAIRFVDEWVWRVGEAVISKFLPQLREAVRTHLLQQTLAKQHNYFVNANSGQIAFWINNGADTVRNIIENIVWSLWPQLFAFFTAIFFLAITSWLLAVVFGVWIVTLVVVLTYRSRRQAAMVAKTSEALSATSGRVSDTIANGLAVRVFAAGKDEVTRLKAEQQKVVDLWYRSWRYGLVGNAYKGNSASLVSGVALIIALVLYSHGNITIGSIAMLITYVTSASETIWALSAQLNTYIHDYGSLKNTLGNLLTEQNERTDGMQLPHGELDIVCENLSFAYPDQPKERVLHNLSFKIAAHERVGIVGHSGAGKSTLSGLLLGLYKPTAGKLLIGGYDINDLALASVRQSIAYVPQDSQLFNRTVAENISYGAKGRIAKAQLEDATRKAQAADFIAKLPDGYQTLVGERGVKLSGGQRQRIAIARAMLSDAPLVILDEATSALDSVSEQAIQKAFAEVMKGRTAMVIAHRLSTLKHLDRIIVIEDGTVAESGTHDELIEQNGIYADLWRRQKDGFLGE